RHLGFARVARLWTLGDFLWLPQSTTQNRRATAFRRGGRAGQNAGDARPGRDRSHFDSPCAGANRDEAPEAGSSGPNLSAFYEGGPRKLSNNFPGSFFRNVGNRDRAQIRGGPFVHLGG